MGTLLFGILVFAIYFLPSIIAYNHRNGTSIFLVNLFLGWTFIGWVVAIVWAFTDDKKEVVVISQNNDNITDQIILLKELYEDGTLTKDEFEQEKKHLLRRKNASN
jgi:hypothetical protein